MKKGIVYAVLLCLFVGFAFAEEDIVQDLGRLAPEAFAQKYITATQNSYQLYEKLKAELGDFDFWTQTHKKQMRDTLPYWETLEIQRQGEASGFCYSNPLYYFFFAEKSLQAFLSEEDAREKAVAWVLEKGLLKETDLAGTQVASSLIVGDYILGDYPSPMWNIRLHGAWAVPIEVWMSASAGKLPKHSSIEALPQGKQAMLEKLQRGELVVSSSKDMEAVIAAEDVEGWYSYAVFFPDREQWKIVFDTGNDSYYWITLGDVDLQEMGDLEGGKG